MRVIPYGHQSIDESDRDAVISVLKSQWLTQGPAIAGFEDSVAAYCGNSVEAVSVSSATAALHVACLAMGLGKGDRLWTSPNTFVATANCALYCGAEVDFVDIDEASLNLCPNRLEDKLREAKASSKLPKIVAPVHFSGRSADMEAIGSLAKKYDFLVLEDASHAIGGTHSGKKIGACHHSDAVVFSFHPVKIVTTAEGGMLVSRDKRIADQARLFRSHGITRDATKMAGESEGPWYYEQIDLGYNYRLTDLQAALGRNQMSRIDQFVARRRELVKKYRQLLSQLPIRLPDDSADSESAWHLFVIRLLDPTRRREVFDMLRESGIGANVHYIPVHLQPYYKNLGFKPGDYPVAEAYYRSAITLPMYYGLSDQDQHYVVDCLTQALA